MRVTIGVVALACAGILTGGGSAVAQTGDPVQVMYACYVPASGTVYRIKATDLKPQCASPQHVQFSWQAQGPKGEPGAQGPVGPQGPQGPAGTDGTLSQMHITMFYLGILAPGSMVSKSYACAAGERVVGSLLDDAAPVTFDGPVGSGDQSSWRVAFANAGPSPVAVSVGFICAKP